MHSVRRKLVGGAVVLIGLIGASVLAFSLYLDHRYARLQHSGDQLPQVIDAPAASLEADDHPAYGGYHPSLVGRPPDPYPYPIPLGETGPHQSLYAGPLQYPFLCRTEESGLGQPLVDNQQQLGIPVYAEDANGHKTHQVIGYSKDCLLRTRVDYYYNRRGSDQFLPLAEAHGDIATIDVQGQPIEFVVRVETGTINRFIYQLAALRGPNESLAQPDPGHWNQRLVYQFRGGVGIGKRQGKVSPASLLGRRIDQLRDGYAVIYSSANQTSNHYNLWLAEETALRVKRQFTARYGEPLYTVGIGGSGGGLQQYLIAQNNPELLDAAIPLYSFPDMVTQTIYAFDCDLLEYYFDITASANDKWREWENRRLIEGLNARSGISNERMWLLDLGMVLRGRWPHFSSGMSECINGWRGLLPLINNPRYVHFAKRFSPQLREQVKWTYWDDLRQIYGTDAQGYAHQTWDNIGVQYGLQALQAGQISAAEFLHLNAKVGSWKPPEMNRQERFWKLGGIPDLTLFSPWSHHNIRRATKGVEVAPRTAGDLAAMQAAYRSGQVFMGRINIPVIDVRHYLEPELNMHHSYASFSSRLRMINAAGHADNQLIWMSRPPFSPVNEAFRVMEEWMLALLAGADRDPVKARPALAQDRCYDGQGKLLTSGSGVWDGAWNGRPDGACMAIYPSFSDSRIVAGEPWSADVFKCRLQSVEQALARGLYGPVDMAPYRQRLAAIFPDGVCDYAQPDSALPANLWQPPPQPMVLSLQQRIPATP